MLEIVVKAIGVQQQQQQIECWLNFQFLRYDTIWIGLGGASEKSIGQRCRQQTRQTRESRKHCALANLAKGKSRSTPSR